MDMNYWEDLKDSDKIHHCILCDSKPEAFKILPDGSVHDGHITIRCPKCKISVSLGPSDMNAKPDGTKTGWDLIYEGLSLAEAKVIEQWNTLHSKGYAKINKAMGMLLDFGSYDGADHKIWTIDQAVRILSGDYQTG